MSYKHSLILLSVVSILLIACTTNPAPTPTPSPTITLPQPTTTPTNHAPTATIPSTKIAYPTTTPP
ncbi:MAG TPA: hypothetical protein VLL52_21170, partial [Anaerolineae bacterium]|nr:hypothetical protein [Anaerolineae bacterium]